jgi:hypothetical protein
VGKIYATDRQMRIYTWNIPLADGTHLYYGHVQSRQDGQVETFHLSHDRSEAPDTLSSYTDANWYGALYYEIIPISCEEKTHYTLLGLDLNNVLTNRKIIDVIRFENGRIFFGAPVFRKGSSVTQRVIFEYSSRVSMMMRYDTTRGMIVVDHLSPSDPRFEGAYQYYGPDFSYDGFRFADCQWNHVEDLDLRGR